MIHDEPIFFLSSLYRDSFVFQRPRLPPAAAVPDVGSPSIQLSDRVASVNFAGFALCDRAAALKLAIAIEIVTESVRLKQSPGRVYAAVRALVTRVVAAAESPQ